MARLAAVLAIALLMTGCQSPATTSSVPASRSPLPSPTTPLAAGQAFGAPGCHPPSPVSSAELPEIRGTTSGGELWALVFGAVPLSKGKQIKIVWRMTGQGVFALSAIGPTGQVVHPDWGPEGHGGSSWNRPGDEWGSGITFPTAGCWDVHATRGNLSGDAYVVVVS